MAFKSQRDKNKNNAIKKHDNHDLSKQHQAENKKNFKLRKRRSRSQDFYELDIHAEIKNNTRILKVTEVCGMGNYYNPNSGIPNYTFPYTLSQWDMSTPQISQIFTVPVPAVPMTVISPPLPLIPAPVLPYTDVLYTPTYTSVVPYVPDNVCTALDHIYEPVSRFAAVTSTEEDYNEVETESHSEKLKSLEYYLTLPKELFPRPKMLTLDPNPIIDELCKIKEIEKHSPWILDLEFGVPKHAVSRAVAVYDVQSNNIFCKNTPGAVHPVFEACSDEFRNVFLFYYDCIVSVWYRGYIQLTNDDSVINFQNWLILPVQALGMCWS